MNQLLFTDATKAEGDCTEVYIPGGCNSKKIASKHAGKIRLMLECDNRENAQAKSLHQASRLFGYACAAAWRDLRACDAGDANHRRSLRHVLLHCGKALLLQTCEARRERANAP